MTRGPGVDDASFGAGVLLIFGTVGLVTEYVVTEVRSGRQAARLMSRSVDALSGHYVLCGYGRVGSTVARELIHDGLPFVIIDVNPASLERARDDDHLVVRGDATLDSTLRAAGITRARGLVAAIDSDAQNVYVILSARAMNPDLFVVARASYRPRPRRRWPGPAPTGSSRPTRWRAAPGRAAGGPSARGRVPRRRLSHGELSFSLADSTLPLGASSWAPRWPACGAAVSSSWPS